MRAPSDAEASEKWSEVPGVRKMTLAGAPWLAFTKAWPAAMDEWTHPRYAPANNAVSSDTLVGPPRRVRWITSPINSGADMVSAGGRNFYGRMFALDAFNGLPLWETPMRNRWPVRAIAVADRIFGVVDRKLIALDAATGEAIKTYHEAGAPTEIYFHEGLLICVDAASLRVLNADSGKQRWRCLVSEPNSVCLGDGALFFTEGNHRRGQLRNARRLELASGKEQWRIEVSRSRKKEDQALSWLPKAGWCVYADGVLIFEVSTFTDVPEGNTIYVLDAENGALLWSRGFDPAGYHAKQARAACINGLVYILADTICFGLDPRTGEVKREFETAESRCYPPVATEQYFISGEMNLTNLETLTVDTHRITKANCSRYARVTPANGLLYTSPKHCVCWPMLNGYSALAAERPTPGTAPQFPLETHGGAELPSLADRDDEWPNYRHDAWRSGSTTQQVAPNLRTLWTADLGDWTQSAFVKKWKENPFVRGPITSPTIAYGRVFIARPDAHELIALDADRGEVHWRFNAAGRIDGPPTLYQGLALFGTRNGWVYCLNAATGELRWRLRAAANDERIVAFGQVESPWPVPASLLVIDGTAYFAAGRQHFADGGIRVFAVEPETGRIKWAESITDMPEYRYYRSEAMEFDGFDLLVREDDAVVMSRWHFDLETGAMEDRRQSGFGHFVTGDSGVIAPRGLWTYGPRMGYSGRRAVKRPLMVFRDNVLYGSTIDKTQLFRRDFSPEDIESFDTQWYQNRVIRRVVAEGGIGTRTERVMEKAAWTVSVSEDDPTTAMVATRDALFVIGQSGALKALAPKDGATLSQLDVPQPIWDGLTAAYGRLYFSTCDGRVVCLTPAENDGSTRTQ